MDLRQLEAFVMVARLGSFAAAADHLCVTQPAISIRIAALEHQLGRKVFDRMGRTVALTPAGQEILSHATRMVTDAQAFRRSAGVPKFMADRIRIGTTDSFLRTSLEPVISRFQALHPTIALDLSVGDTTFVWLELLAGRVDVGFHANTQPHPSLRGIPLFVTELVWVAKPGLVQASRSLTLSEIAGFQIFTPRHGSIAYSAVADLFGRAGIARAKICGIDSVEGVIRFTEAGLGLGVVTRIVAEERVRLGRLQELSPAPPLPPVNYVVSHRIDSLSDAGLVLTNIAAPP